MKKIFPAFIILLKGDTLAGKWNGKWDPTDPLCPCYDIQKQADKEYQDMLKKDQKKDSVIIDGKKPDTSDLNPDKTISKTDRQDMKAVKNKGAKKRNKSRERKYKKGKAVCPEVRMSLKLIQFS
jgi:hypothetical protein